MPEQSQPKAKELLSRVQQVLTQKPKDQDKIYAIHAPYVECISKGKGKARKPYEFGVKVSIAITLKEGYVVSMRSMPGNPRDGHTLHEPIEQMSILNNYCTCTIPCSPKRPAHNIFFTNGHLSKTSLAVIRLIRDTILVTLKSEIP